MTCTRGASMVQGFTSNVCGSITMDHRGPLKCVIDTVVSPVHHRQRSSQTFCQEAVMWKRLTHPNILPLLGIIITPLQLISKWISSGDLPGYIKRHPNADRLVLVGATPMCLPMLTLVVSYPTSLKASATSTLAMWFMGTSKECVILLDIVSHPH